MHRHPVAGNWACSAIPNVVNNFDEKPKMPLSGSSSPVPGDFRLSYIDSPSPGHPGVRDQVPGENPYLACNANGRPGWPREAPGDSPFSFMDSKLGSFGNPGSCKRH